MTAFGSRDSQNGGKAIRHTTFRVLLITVVLGKTRRVVCCLAIPAKSSMERQTSKLAHLSNVHLALGLAFPAFLVFIFSVVPFTMQFPLT